MKYFFLVGEASGDMHAAALMDALRERDPEALFMGLGGERMQRAGARLFQDYRHMAFMGVIAVLRNLRQIKENFRIAEQALLSERPDALILVDYPSFNLKMADFARRHLPNIKIIYYIPPKIWAWKTYRIHKIARLCDEVLGIFPFEPAFYAKFGYRCTYVGNPSADAIVQWRENVLPLPRQSVIALLPGSRMGEIKNCLPKMLVVAREAQQQGFINQIVVAASPGIDNGIYANYLQNGETLTRDTWALLSRAKVAIVTSGTATLETALLNCPQLSVYRIYTSRWLGWLGPFIFKIPYYTLVNIVANKQVIYEAIGPKFSTTNIRRELHRLLTEDTYKKNMLANYKHIYELLCKPSSIQHIQLQTTSDYMVEQTAPQRAAAIIVSLLLLR